MDNNQFFMLMIDIFKFYRLKKDSEVTEDVT